VNTLPVIQTETIVKFGIAALAIGAFFGVSVPVEADTPLWVRVQNANAFKVRGLVPPGSYSNKDNRKPVTIGVSKSGKGVGEKRQTTSKLGQKNAHQATNLNKADERWLNIYKSQSFGVG
jgi:hypothetical protein